MVQPSLLEIQVSTVSTDLLRTDREGMLDLDSFEDSLTFSFNLLLESFQLPQHFGILVFLGKREPSHAEL